MAIRHARSRDIGQCSPIIEEYMQNPLKKSSCRCPKINIVRNKIELCISNGKSTLEQYDILHIIDQVDNRYFSFFTYDVMAM